MQWISVKDRLPDHFDRVLTVLQYVDAPFDMENGGYEDNKEFLTDPIVAINNLDMGYRWRSGGIVTYWMPLPEPPKENE